MKLHSESIRYNILEGVLIGISSIFIFFDRVKYWIYHYKIYQSQNKRKYSKKEEVISLYTGEIGKIKKKELSKFVNRDIVWWSKYYGSYVLHRKYYFNNNEVRIIPMRLKQSND